MRRAMYHEPPAVFDHLLALPLWAMALLIVGAWLLLAAAIHRWLVPWLVGRKASDFGRFETEVASQLGIAFGLLLSFNAVDVWSRIGDARNAVMDEASALREAADQIDHLPEALRRHGQALLHGHLDTVVTREWPLLGSGRAPLERPSTLRDLAGFARSSGDEDLEDLISAATRAREDRVRISAHRMLPLRWVIVFLLGAFTLLALGLAHGEHPVARRLALGLSALAIASCFAVLFAQARPFLGPLALQPNELRALAATLESPQAHRADN